MNEAMTTPATLPPWQDPAIPPLSVLIVEDDFATRRQLLGKLSDGTPHHVQVAATLGEGLEHLDRHEFDVILVDLGLPDGSGLRIIEAAAAREKPPEVLVLSALRDEASVVAAISAGAGGYVVKDASATDILDAVHNMVAGFSPISPSIARFLLRAFRQGFDLGAAGTEPTATLLPMGLTKREYDVLLEITRGASYKQIARSLAITEGTVQTHIKNVYRKLGVSNRSEAAYRFSQLQDS